MSQNGDSADTDGAGPSRGLSPEALQQYLAALAEDRDASVERTEGILARFFKVAIVMVCLNVVIAGANVVMILIRPRTVAAAAPVPTPPVATPYAEPPTPAAIPVLATPAPAVAPIPAAETPGSSTAAQPAVSAKPAMAPKPAAAPQPEKKVPLLGPLPAPKPAATGVPMLARRPARPPAGRVMLAKPFLSADEYEDPDDGRPLGPPERW